ncbi:MAG: oligosaccharide flippase family protein [Candidatus Kapaibacterium sp.]
MSRSLTKDGLLVVLSDGGTRLLTFIANAYLAKVLAPTSYGVAFLGLTILSYGMLPADLGLYALGVREMAKEKSQREFQFSDFLWLRTMLGLAGMLLTGVGILLFIHEEQTRSVALLFLLALIPSLWQMDWYYQGGRRYGELTLIRYLFSGSYLVGILFFVSGDNNLERIPLIYSASIILAAVAAFVLKRDSESILPRESFFNPKLWGEWRAILRRSIPIGLGSILAQSVPLIPPIVIAAMYDEEQVGLFGAAFRLTMIMLVIDRTFFTLFLPRISRVNTSSPERAPEVLRRTFRWLILIGLCLGVGIIPIAEPIVVVVNRSEYAGAALPLILMSWFVSATILTTFFSYALVAAGYEKAYFQAALVSTPITLLLIFLLTWQFGIVGTAVSISLAEIIMATLMYRKFRRHLGVRLW